MACDLRCEAGRYYGVVSQHQVNNTSVVGYVCTGEGNGLQTKPYRTSKRAQPACDRGALHAFSYAVLASPSSTYLEASKSRPSSLG